jgi:hypothetical protein
MSYHWLPDVNMRRFARRWLTAAGNQTVVAVTAAATTKAITWARDEQDALYGVNATPNWLTQIAVTAKTTAGCTISFSVAAPVGATVDVSTFRSE